MTEKEIRDLIRDEGDRRWRKIDDCDDISGQVDEKVTVLDKKFEVANTKLSGILWLVGICAAAAVSIAFELILGRV